MKLLLDEGIPSSIAALLRERGVDTVHVGELDLSAAADTTIIQDASLYGYCIVTLDADFPSLLAVASAPGPSVIRLRVQRLKASAAAALIWSVLERLRQSLRRRELVTARLLTIAQTCRLHQRSPLPYLAQAISYHRLGLPAPRLLPHPAVTP